MSDVTEFLLARIAEDEAVARAATRGPRAVNDEDYAEAIHGHDGMDVVSGGKWGGEAAVFDTSDALHIARWDPARVLAECEAKRRIIDLAFEYAEKIDGEWGCVHDADDIRRGYFLLPGLEDEPEPLPAGCYGPPNAARFLSVLALPYAGHPDYRDEWRP